MNVPTAIRASSSNFPLVVDTDQHYLMAGNVDYWNIHNFLDINYQIQDKTRAPLLGAAHQSLSIAHAYRADLDNGYAHRI